MGILVDHRGDVSPSVQEVLSGFGEQILMRAGVPSPDRRKGLIALVIEADEAMVGDLTRRLEAIDGVIARTASF